MNHWLSQTFPMPFRWLKFIQVAHINSSLILAFGNYYVHSNTRFTLISINNNIFPCHLFNWVLFQPCLSHSNLSIVEAWHGIVYSTLCINTFFAQFFITFSQSLCTLSPYLLFNFDLKCFYFSQINVGSLILYVLPYNLIWYVAVSRSF